MEKVQLHTREFLKSRDLDEREFKKVEEIELFSPSPDLAIFAKQNTSREEMEAVQPVVVYGEDLDFSDENVHPENHPKFPRWRKIVLKVGIGVTTFGVLAILTPIPLGWLITPIGVGIMTIAIGKKHAGRHLKSIFIKMTDWVATEGKKFFARKKKQETVENKQ